jgi:hypothetical protein
MKEERQLFPGQLRGEVIYKVIRKHWINYIPFFLVSLAVAIVLISVVVVLYINGVFADPASVVLTTVVSGTGLLATLALLIYGFINYYLDSYIITNQRIVDISQDSLFLRRVSELHIHQIQDVSAKVEGFVGTAFHVGDVYIQTAGERENFAFKSIEHPYRIAKIIIDLHERQFGENPNLGIKDIKAEAEAREEFDYIKEANIGGKIADKQDDEDEDLFNEDLLDSEAKELPEAHKEVKKSDKGKTGDLVEGEEKEL